MFRRHIQYICNLTLYSQAASLHEVYKKWVPANLVFGKTPPWTSIPLGGRGEVEIRPVASCYRNRDNPRSYGPLGSYVDFTRHIINSSFNIKFQLWIFNYG